MDRILERLSPEEEQLSGLFRVSAEVHFLPLHSLRTEDKAGWKRAVEVLSHVTADIVEGRIPQDAEPEERTGLRAHYAELQELIQQHRSDPAS